MSTATEQRVTGKVTQVIGSTFDAEFPEGHLPEIYNALTIQSEHKGVTDQPDRRSATALGWRSRPGDRAGQYRRNDAWNGSGRYGQTDCRSRRQRNAGPRL